MSSSRRSSVSSNNSVLTECEAVEDKNETKIVATSRECENHVEQKPTTGKIETTETTLQTKVRSTTFLDAFQRIHDAYRDYFMVGERERFLFTSKLLQANE